jgi:cyclase
MLKNRLIPILLLKNGVLVRSETFNTHQIIGNPIHEVERFNEWNVDELIYIDISREDGGDLHRNDSKITSHTDPLQILESVSKTCFMPLTWGGRIRSTEEMRERFSRGADKVTLNTGAIENPDLITEASRLFGSQAIVLSVDVRRHGKDSYEVVSNCGRTPTGMAVQDWVVRGQKLGAGEVFLQSLDEDGMAEGYDTRLIQIVASSLEIPLIACSGVGRFEDYAAGIAAGASAVAAANLWHFKELADRAGKRAMASKGISVRK